MLALGLSACNKAQSDSTRLSNLGMRALAKGQVRTANGYFEDAVSIYPQNASAQYGLGVTLLELGKPDRAKKHLGQAAELKPDLVESRYHLGSIALSEKKTEAAEQEFRAVLDRDPDHAPALHLMALIHEGNGALKDAEVSLRKSITLDPYNPAAFLSLARLYIRVHAEKEALVVLREGVRVGKPELINSGEQLALLHNELGIMLQERGQYGQAIDELLKAVNLPGAPTEIAFNLGWAYASKGDPEHALRYFRQYIDLVDSSDPAARVAVDVARHLAARVNTPPAP